MGKDEEIELADVELGKAETDRMLPSEEKPVVPPKNPMLVIFWTTFYLLCSSTMLIINKGTVTYLPMPMFLLVLQAAASVLILLVGRRFGIYEFPGFDANKGRQWIGVTIAWAAPMVVNMEALQYSTVETVIVFRILSTFGIAVGDFYWFGSRFTTTAICTMVVTVGGGLLYGSSDQSFTMVGYFWGFMYFLATVVNGLYIKFMFNKVAVSMSNVEKTYYNNLMAVPVLLLFSFGAESAHWGNLGGAFAEMGAMGAAIIFLSCVMGTAIGVAGTNCRDLLSATSFNIAGNINKFFTVGLSVLLFHTPITSDSATGLLIALSGGAAYAWVTRPGQKK